MASSTRPQDQQAPTRASRPIELGEVHVSAFGFLSDSRPRSGEELRSIHGAARFVRPQTPLATSTLLTRNLKEPSLGGELAREIASSDRIDVLVGSSPWEAFGWCAMRSRRSRKVSYDINRTRLHAKAWLFHRHTGLHTAYIGSANLTSTALGSGQEWMVKACAADLPDVVEKFNGTFESLWNDSEFEPFVPGEAASRERLRAALTQSEDSPSMLFFALRPLGDPIHHQRSTPERPPLPRLSAERRVLLPLRPHRSRLSLRLLRPRPLRKARRRSPHRHHLAPRAPAAGSALSTLCDVGSGVARRPGSLPSSLGSEQRVRTTPSSDADEAPSPLSIGTCRACSHPKRRGRRVCPWSTTADDSVR